ncbi:MAG: helix-turn-helix domain-containing protein [Clostridiales bacterium]|nr:helix-turn-helix domain-containing protein [Clostridiales bacterium]
MSNRKNIKIGENIARLRKEKGWTQEKLAEELGVTFQAVSSWERDEYKPELETFIELAEKLGVPATWIIEERSATFNTKEAVYNWEHMKTYVKTFAKTAQMENTLKALDFALAAHEGQPRKNSELPYIVHPLNMACHALALGIKEDEIIAGILLHDVIEDCKKEDGTGYTTEDLPVNDETRKIVALMTCPEKTPETREAVLTEYYKGLATYPKAALVKLIDRCNNLTTMSWGLERWKIYRMIRETDKYYPVLIKVVKDIPEYNDAAWLLKYQIDSTLDVYKRLM